jgi:2-C-methyl-D-erythritol 4-phosphate cytidylyltransferase
VNPSPRASGTISLSVIIVAAGSSVRMGFDKLASPLAGKPVLQHSLDAFLALPAVREIVVVCPPERFGLLDSTRRPPALGGQWPRRAGRGRGVHCGA